MNQDQQTTPEQLEAIDHQEQANHMTEVFLTHYEDALAEHGDAKLKEAIMYDDISFMLEWNMNDNGCNEFKSALQMMGSAVQTIKDENEAKKTVRHIAAVAVLMTMERIESDDMPAPDPDTSFKIVHPFVDTILSIKEAKKGWPNVKICKKCKVQKVTDRNTFKVTYQKVVSGIAYQSPNLPKCRDMRTIEEVKRAL